MQNERIVKAKSLDPGSSSPLQFVTAILTCLAVNRIEWRWKCGSCGFKFYTNGPMKYGRHYATCRSCKRENYADY